MACKMLFFDYREPEEKFFKENKYDSYDIKFFKESLNELSVDELSQEDLDNTMIISVSSASKINRNVLPKFKNLRIISTRTTDYEHIDVNCCLEKNIALINVNSYGTKAVAQFALGMIILLVRKICPSMQFKPHMLIPKNFCGNDLNTMTLGIIGTGTVGASVCKYAHALEMKILAFDTTPNKDLVGNFNVEYINKQELLKLSDIVLVAIPYCQEHYHSFSYESFKQMKSGSYFINISRGEFVDNEALLEIAKTGKFKGIGLDVVACKNPKALNSEEPESSSEDCIETSASLKELSKLPNVIITPQISHDTQESVDYILKTTFDGLSSFLQGGRKHRVI